MMTLMMMMTLMITMTKMMMIYKNDDLDNSDPVCEVRSVISRIAAQLSFPKTFVFMLQCNCQIMIMIAA